MTTLLQVFSRIFIVWGIIPLFPDSIQDSYAYPIMLLAWSVTEVIRYSFYAWNILDEVPYFLLWLRYNYLRIWVDCRYSTFWVLYPIGVGSELRTMTRALKDAYAWQPVYAAVIVVVMLAYIPGTSIVLSF
jgi:very-long-chain (3R)-3-hydroxyacyl-CoA dehydratase